MDHELNPARETVAPSGTQKPNSRTATTADVGEMSMVLTEAFFDDPVWGPAFPDLSRRRDQAREYWSFSVEEALRFPDSLVAEGPGGDIEALAVWFPPAADEIREARLGEYDALVRRLLGDVAAESLFEASNRFGAARPTAPHAYLTLLAVAPSARGRGAGLALLSEALKRFDAEGMPTYLESSNPANDRKYESLGYRPHGVVQLTGGQSVQTYWRDPV